MLAYNYKIIWNSRKRFSGIIIEQALVFIVLMLCMVTIISTIQKYRTPGLLNTKNVMLFGYTTVDDSQDDLDEIYKNVDAIKSQAEKIYNSAKVILDSHVETIINKINNFKIENKVIKKINKIKNNFDINYNNVVVTNTSVLEDCNIIKEKIKK